MAIAWTLDAFPHSLLLGQRDNNRHMAGLLSVLGAPLPLGSAWYLST